MSCFGSFSYTLVREVRIMVNSIRKTIVLKIFYLYNFYLGAYISVCGGQKKGVRFLRAEVIGSC